MQELGADWFTVRAGRGKLPLSALVGSGDSGKGRSLRNSFSLKKVLHAFNISCVAKPLLRGDTQR